MKAPEKRLAAIKAIVDTYAPADKYDQPVDAERAAQAIGEIAKLGRYDRWWNAVARWKGMVESAPPESQHWAVVQGAIMAGYAAI